MCQVTPVETKQCVLILWGIIGGKQIYNLHRRYIAFLICPTKAIYMSIFIQKRKVQLEHLLLQ